VIISVKMKSIHPVETVCCTLSIMICVVQNCNVHCRQVGRGFVGKSLKFTSSNRRDLATPKGSEGRTYT